jgi:hypothetical protein
MHCKAFFAAITMYINELIWFKPNSVLTVLQMIISGKYPAF